MTTLQLKKSIGWSPWRFGFLLIPLMLASLALLPIARAASEGDLGHGNTNEGLSALLNLTTGIHNNAFGNETLLVNTTGSYNTATGSQSLKNNTANNNTAMGFQSLVFNTIGSDNTAVGWRALYQNTSGVDNTATGFRALYGNNGSDNNAFGAFALHNNLTGVVNNAFGFNALSANVGAVFGDMNNAFGANALASNVEGRQNSAFGDDALEFSNGDRNTAVGNEAGTAVTTGSFNVYLGDNAGSNFNHVNESNTIRIGSDTGFDGIDPTRCFIAGIWNVVPVGASHTVVINSAGQLADLTASSRRFKKDIAPIDKISEGVLALKPVAFHFKSDYTNTAQFGLIAEEVAEVNPDWITRGREGEIYGVRYEAINILLLNEFLKEHKKVQNLEVTVAQQQKGMEVLTAQLKEQAAQIQKVSAQFEVNKPTPKMVLTNP